MFGVDSKTSRRQHKSINWCFFSRLFAESKWFSFQLLSFILFHSVFLQTFFFFLFFYFSSFFRFRFFVVFRSTFSTKWRPIYIDDDCNRNSIDSRERNVKFGTHSAIANDLGERLFFVIDDNNNKNARLQIKNVHDTDGGVYRCRVDFFNSATRNSRINLTLVGKLSYIFDLFWLFFFWFLFHSISHHQLEMWMKRIWFCWVFLRSLILYRICVKGNHKIKLSFAMFDFVWNGNSMITN